MAMATDLGTFDDENRESIVCGKAVLQVHTSKCESVKDSCSTSVVSAKEPTVPKSIPTGKHGVADETSIDITKSTEDSSAELSPKKADRCQDCSEECESPGGKLNGQEIGAKAEIPLLERLRVVKVARETRFDPPLPLPDEVVVEDRDTILLQSTQVSELGVDGIPSRCSSLEERTYSKSTSHSEEKRICPTRFTFDGVVPSVSSSGEAEESKEETATVLNDMVSQDRSERITLASLKSPTSETVCRHAMSLKKIDEHSRTISTSEMSIELSESQYFRTCEGHSEEEHYFLSPLRRSSSESETLGASLDQNADAPIPGSWNLLDYFNVGLW